MCVKFQLQTLLLKRSNVGEENRLKDKIQIEMNENPKVIQQLLGHRDVKTTITVYNSVDSEYIRQTTDKFNERVKEDQMLLNDKKREEILEQRKGEFVADMDDDEFDEILTKLLEERKERKRKRESDMEM